MLVHLRKGVLQYCVLACLVNGPMYARQLATHLGTGGVLLESEGTLYPLLSRMRAQGWVQTAWRESKVGPPRRYYELSDEGKAALDNFVDSWSIFGGAVDKILKELP